MSPLDLMIIYLTLAAPFGVYELTQHRNQSAMSSVIVFVAWPVFAVRLFARWLTSDSRARRKRDERLAGIRSRFERSLPAGDNAGLFIFREEFQRFVGLTESLHLPAAARGSELSKITSHPDPQLAARCLGRRNMEKIRHHQALATAEIASHIASIPDGRADISAGKIELAAYLQIDPTTLDGGRRRSLISPVGRPISSEAHGLNGRRGVA